MIFEEKSKKEIIDYLFSEINNLISNKYDYEFIGIPKGITKSLDEYAVKNPWVEGVKWSEKNLVGYQFSPKPFLLYIKKDKKYNTNVICFDNNNQVPRDIKIDYEKMLNGCVFNIVKKILRVIKIDENIINNYIKNKCSGQQTL